MATEEEVNKQKELNEGKSFQKSLEQDLLELIQRRMGISSNALNEQQDIANALKDQLKQVKLERSEKDLILRITNKLNSLTAKNYALLEDEVGTTKTLKSIKKDQEAIDKNILLLINQKKKIQDDTTKKTEEEQGFANNLVENLQAQIEKARDFKGELKQAADLSSLIANDLAVKTIDAIKDIAIAIPGLRKFAAPFEIAAAAAKLQALENQKLHGSTKGITKEKLKEIQLALEQRKLLTDQLKTGKGLDKQRVKALIEQGILEEKQFKIKENHYVTGNAASAKAMKLGIIDSLKPLEQIPKVVSPLEAGFKALGPILKKALGPVALLVMLVKALTEADKATGDLAKSMNMTYSEANAVRMELNKVANISFDAFVTTKGLQESFSFINSQLGSNVMLSGKLLTQFTKLREVSGLTNEELYGATQLQLTSNKTLNEITGEIMAQAKLTAKNNGVILNEKQILKEIKDVSAATTLSLGKNPSAIAEAVTQAKALGMTLGQVEKIAESLLNFESSITSELKAELLLGRDINLERARLFALNNNIAGVAREISSQIGNSADFARMNVLQQKALAEAVGMNREELAKTLFVQENLGAATGDAADKRKSILNSLIREKGLEEAKRILGKKSIEDLENQASIQDRFNQSVLKLKEIFVSLAGPILQIISPFVDLITTILPAVNFLLTPIIAGVNIIAEGFRYISDSVKSLFGVLTGSNEQLTLMQGIVGTIASIYLAIKGYALTTKILQGASLAIEAARGGFAQKRLLLESQGLIKQVGSAIFSVISSFSKIPFGVGVGLGLVAAAGIASMASKYLKGDDIMSPGAGSGYGSRTLMGPEGAIALNNKDTVIAGTDLFNSSNSSPTPMTTPINQNQNTSMEVSQLKAENAAIKQESKKTNNLLENLISATKANKTVEMDDPFGALYTV
jgi:hypothetical protein